MGIRRMFAGEFKNIIFVQVGMVDAGVFKGVEERERLKTHIQRDLDRYVNFVRARGLYAEGISSVGVDVVEEVVKLTPELQRRFPRAIFFGGQWCSPATPSSLHNHIVFAVQRQLYLQGVAFVIMPIRLQISLDILAVPHTVEQFQGWARPRARWAVLSPALP